MKLFRHADVYAPEHLGMQDLLLEGGTIVHMAPHIDIPNIPPRMVYDLQGKRLCPGYIDLHVHITGGGGEQGPASRTPEATIGELLTCGVTTVVGLLGTDGVSRSLENLLFKARALTQEGITAYILTGSYGYPPVTLTGSVERDLMLIPEVIGVKTALSDHRSSHPLHQALIDLGSTAHRGGMLSGGTGLVCIHMGDGKGGLTPLFQVLDASDIPAKTFLPTHVNTRSQALVDQGITLTQQGGWVDFTAEDTQCENDQLAELIGHCLTKGMDVSRLTLSSDGYGSQPRFDHNGDCIGLTYATPRGLHQVVKALVSKGILPLEQALSLVTSTPAQVLGKADTTGIIALGAVGDFVVLDEDMNIESVFAQGVCAIWKGERTLKGRFEP